MIYMRKLTLIKPGIFMYSATLPAMYLNNVGFVFHATKCTGKNVTNNLNTGTGITDIN